MDLYARSILPRTPSARAYLAQISLLRPLLSLSSKFVRLTCEEGTDEYTLYHTSMAKNETPPSARCSVQQHDNIRTSILPLSTWVLRCLLRVRTHCRGGKYLFFIHPFHGDLILHQPQVAAYQQASPCQAAPCRHGTCLASSPSTYVCQCHPGYSGKR